MQTAEDYKRLAKKCPEAAMVRAALEHSLQPDLLEEMFEDCRTSQYTHELAFSVLIKLLHEVVSRNRPSVNSAYTLHEAEIGVSKKAVYDKLNATDPSVSEGLVRYTAERVRDVIDELGVHSPSVIPGYRTRIIDGNQFAATEHRLKELRRVGSGPLPGKALVVWDGERSMVSNVYCCEDGHAQERRILLDVVNDVEAGELWIADRNFAVSWFAWEIDNNKAFFIFRRHKRNIRLRSMGEERYVGDSETGKVYEEAVAIEDDFGNEFMARKIRIVLHSPTGDGDTEIELLSNLPANVSAVAIAEAYRTRWRIETAFFELDRLFEGEIRALAHPRAALLMFCLSLVAYNALKLTRAALAAVHGKESEQQLSEYYFSQVVVSDWRALEVHLPPTYWSNRFGNCTPRALASELKSLAKNVNMSRLRKTTRGPKKPRPKRSSAKNKPHVSTYRLLRESGRIK